MEYFCNYTLVTSDIIGNTGAISIKDGHAGANLLTLTGQKLVSNSIAIIKDTLIGCVEGKLQLELWGLRKEGKKKVIPVPAPARAMVYYEDLNILSCFLGHDVYMWQPESGQLLATLSKFHSHPGTQILMTLKNNVITVDESGLIVFWRMNFTGFSDVLWKSRPFGIGKLFCILIEERNEIFVVSEAGKFIILSLCDGHSTFELSDLSMSVRCVERYQNKMFIGCSQGKLVIFNLDLGEIAVKTILQEKNGIEHNVTQIVLTPDMESIVIVLDNREAFTIYIGETGENFCISRIFTCGLNVNSLCAVFKSQIKYATDSSQDKLLINRLSFSTETSTVKNIEIHLRKQDKSAQDIIDSFDTSLDFVYRQMPEGGVVVQSVGSEPDKPKFNNLHKFKKKKLKQMFIDPEHGKLLTKLELLISRKRNWTGNDLENVFQIMHDDFEVASIYGFQIEMGLLEYVDRSAGVNDIHLAAHCMARFANIKKSNGTQLLQSLIGSLVAFGKELFDYFNVTSNLSDINCPFENDGARFDALPVNDDTIWILVKRISFLLYSIEFVLGLDCDLSFQVPYDELIRVLIAFLNTTPSEIATTNQSKHSVNQIVPYYLSIRLWKLFRHISSIDAFRGCLYEYVPNICQIVNVCVTETNVVTNPRLYRLYMGNILRFSLDLVRHEGRFCWPVPCCLMEPILNRLDSISTAVCSDIDEGLTIDYLRVVNEFFKYQHDAAVTKCMDKCARQIAHVRKCLTYVQHRRIFRRQDFNDQFRIFIDSVRHVSCDLRSDVKEDATLTAYSLEQLTTQLSNEIVDVPTLLLVNDDVDMETHDVIEIDTEEVEKIDVTINVHEMEIENEGDKMENATAVEQFDDVRENVEVVIDSQPSTSEVISDKSDINCAKDVDLEEMLRSFVPY